MDTVICSCLKCHAWIGKFENLWDRIGKTYYSPICNRSQDLGGLVTAGEVREAAKTGVIESSFLQDLACKGCGEKLGLRCDNAPASHILIKDQLILRIGGMSIVTEDTGEKAFLRVRRKFSLTGPQSPSVDKQEGREQSICLIGSHAAVENEPHPVECNTVMSGGDSDPLLGLVRFTKWAEAAISEQRKDISRISSVVSKMEKDMRSFMDFMVETRRDLATVPAGRPWERMKRSVTLLEEAVGSIRMELEARPDAGGLNEDDEVKLSVEELDVLTGSITKISQKVNEVESLKMELQFMKTRLKRFEDAFRAVRQPVEPRVIESSPVPTAIPGSSTPRLRRVVSEGNAGRDDTRSPRRETLPRKRKSDEFESNSSSGKVASPVSSSPKKRIPLDPPAGYMKMQHKPSRLSNVQYLDDFPDPVDAEEFVDGNQNEEDRQTLDEHIREYESAPETRPFRRKTLPSRQNGRRGSSSPEEVSPPPKDNTTNRALSSMGSRLQILQRTAASPGKSRRRAYSEGLRNEDGVRLTKNGTPDRRSGNYRYLKQYQEKLRLQQQQNKDTGQAQDNREKTYLVPSIETEAPEQAQEVDRKAIKHAELEARDRLVRETLQRELES